jgi:uncharacterized protein (DUF983 family)
MTEYKKDPNRGYASSVLGCYCPRCREGKLFQYGVSLSLKKNLLMHENCPVCGQPTDIEVGFYYGTGFVSYFLAVVISVITFLLWWLIIGFSFSDNRFMWWVILNAVGLILLQPWLMRFSRSLWISWFVRYDPHWKHTKPDEIERINPEQSGNW